MTERIEGEVLYSIPPSELGEHDLDPELQSLAGTSHVLVCRRGGHPSIFELAWAMLRRKPIEPVTIVARDGAAEGDVVELTVEETTNSGVYRQV